MTPPTLNMREILHTTVFTDSLGSAATAGTQTITHNDVPGAGGTWSIEHRVLHGGKQDQSEIIIVDTGMLKMTLIPTRGMGILNVTAGDIRLGWDSPIKEIVHPLFINLESRNGLGWLEGFNEWMCRCGLEFSGHPGTDEFINNVGATDSMMLTLHGKIANIPCSRSAVTIEHEDARTFICIHGTVHERVFHGPKLELETTIIIPIDEASFHIEDTVTNAGSQPQEYQMLYHCNFGTPLLEKGSTFIANVATNEPFNERAAEGLTTFNNFNAPTPGFIEQVYKLTLRGDANHNTAAMLQNAAADRGASMSFSLDELPFFTLWKNTDAIEDGYVTGLEPGTCFPHNRKIERAAGRVSKLLPQQQKSFRLDVQLHLNRDAVAQKRLEIEQIAS